MNNAESQVNDSDMTFEADGALSMDAMMGQNLPGLIDRVKAGWEKYKEDPRHEHIDAMRADVESLLYWTARKIARGSIVSYNDGGKENKIKVGLFGNYGCTDIQHDIYAKLRGRKKVTQLVEMSEDNFIGFLNAAIRNAKIDLFRAYKSKNLDIKNGEGTDSENVVYRLVSLESVSESAELANISSEECVEVIQATELFSKFLSAEQINDKLMRVTWLLWTSTPFYTTEEPGDGEAEGNKAHTNEELARQIGMPISTFERYKSQARMLIKRFLVQAGY